ncbi:MAG: chorismate mutase [Kiritimatiellae bacterium]|nr:chorismate mutase [Kiritimatiellia bacterium]
MTKELQLDHLRGVLVRLEETIIFGLIERAQFLRNPPVYELGGMGGALAAETLLEFMLHETERSHAKVRRYTSPDEHSFFDDLPDPILPALTYAENPLHTNRVNVNAQIMEMYVNELVPFICAGGDDANYGSCAVIDVNLLQALSKRIHYGMFIAESKYREESSVFDPLIRANDAAAIEAAITAAHVEVQLYERVSRKASAYGSELLTAGDGGIAPDKVRTIYERWIIPPCKQVEVAYLLQRLDD